MGHHHVTLDFETQEFADDFADSVRRSGEVIVEAGDSGIEESCAAEVVPDPEENLPLLGILYQSACMAADLEALRPAPASAIRTQKKTGTADYTFPSQPRVDELAALDAEYERRSGRTGISYVSRPGDGSSVFHFGDGEHRRSRAAAIRYLRELIDALPSEPKKAN